MLPSVGFLLAVSIIQCVTCLTCLHCTGIQSPRHCNYVMDCGHGEVCNVHQTTNHYGDVVFDVGCAHPSACSNRTHGSKTCDECCSTDLCNAAGCGMPGYPTNRGPVCYDCPAQITDGTCHIIDVCGGNEVCLINAKREFGDKVFTSGCVGLTHCERHTMDISQIIGRSISDSRSLAETVCHKCCHDDLCNAHCEFDPCSFDTCLNNGKCTSHGALNYTCVCTDGYIGDYCETDVDECASGTSYCQHECVNFEGAYTCTCRDGYEVDRKNTSLCIDVNECLAGTADCAHECTNTNGTFRCSCRNGYALAINGKSCEDMDECSRQTHDCQQQCSNTYGSFVCSCRMGFRLRIDNKTCTDCMSGTADVVFLVDESSSVGRPNFASVIQFISAIVKELTIGPAAVQVGWVRFASTPTGSF